jgi:hypothetical protein
MKRLLKIFLILTILSGLIVVWYWADNQDYFQGDYSDLTEKQNIIFKWQDGDDGDKLMTRYRQHFADTEFVFPRQKVTKVKLFKNTPIIGVFSGKTLKQNRIDTFLKFCNDTTNFDWGETTWGISESEYYVRLYNSETKVVGKIYFCLDDCGMTSAKPFCPAMKFGGLSATGLDNINNLINSKGNWE